MRPSSKPIDIFFASFKNTPKISTNEWCPRVETSKIGLVYIFVPDRMQDPNKHTSKSEYKDNIFKLNHYYSLIALIKLFKPSEHNPLLFYHVNEWGKPRSNHYNRWLNDSFWYDKLFEKADLKAKNSIHYIEIKHKYDYQKHDFNMYDIMNDVKDDCMKRFTFYPTKTTKKTHVLMLTSDLIIGPKVMTCFSQDKPHIHAANTLINLDSIRLNMPNECYQSLNDDVKGFSILDKGAYSLDSVDSGGVYSFLYKLDVIHRSNDFSGMLIWKIVYNSSANSIQIPFKSIDSSLVNQFNVYRCVYKNDLMKSSSANFKYEETFCIFGFELNIYEPPNLQHLFLTQEKNYLFQTLRFHLFNQTNPIKYKYNDYSWEEDKRKIPNVVHLIWFSTPYRGLKFIEYLCLKSILAVIKPERVRIHGDNQPHCDLWKKIKRNPKIEWV